MDGLLLDAAAVNSAMHASGMTVASTGTITGMWEDSTGTTDKNCLAVEQAAGYSVYSGTGWTAMRGQELASSGSTITQLVSQNVIAFPSAHDAAVASAAVSRSWSACSSRTYNWKDSSGQHDWSVGSVSIDRGTVTIMATWEVTSLQPHPDATLAGEYSTTNRNGCEEKRAVTFTCTGDVDVNSLPDPAALTPRVVSLAEALRGRYHETETYTNANPSEYDVAVRTDCLRTGDRCISHFHNASTSFAPLVFDGGKWIVDFEADEQCPTGGTNSVKISADYPPPQPTQDPITLLTGHGHQDQTAPCAASSDFDDKFVRAGD